MGGAEWAFLWTIVGLAGTTTLGWSLLAAIWGGRRPRGLRLATAAVSAVLVLSGLAFPTTLAQQALVAGVDENEPSCSNARIVEVEQLQTGVRIRGAGGALGECGIWAVIEDPRTGVLWLQGGAAGTAASWSLNLVLGADLVDGKPLPYHVSLLVVSPETQRAWTGASVGGDPLILGKRPAANAWVARDLVLSASP